MKWEGGPIEMTLTDEGVVLLFGRGVMAERLLWELTEGDPFDHEMGDLLCCDSWRTEDIFPPGRRWDSIRIAAHHPECSWLRAHKFLNRSTDHGHYVHEFAS